MTRSTRYFMAGSAAVLAAGLCTGLVAYYGGGFQALSASTGPIELRYVPPDAAVIAYADVGAIMNSELRLRIKEAMPMHQKGQEEFQRETGIDIERDIQYVVAAVTPGTHSALLVARGNFNPTCSRTWPSSTAASSRPTARSGWFRRPPTVTRPEGRHPRVPRARPGRHRRYRHHQARHRRPADRREHHRQRRDDDPRAATSRPATTPGRSAGSTSSPPTPSSPNRLPSRFPR